MRPLLVALAALLVVGCAHHASVGPPPVPPRGPTRDSLIALDLSRGDTLAALGPVEGVLTLLHPDVVYLRAGVPAVYGKQAARVLLGAALNSDLPVLWQPLGGGISADGRSGYTYGVTTRAATGRTGGGLRVERYIAYWQREPKPLPAGRWRVLAYAEIGGVPASEALVRPVDTMPAARRLTPRKSNIVAQLYTADSAFADLADRMGLADAFSSNVAGDGVLFAGPELVVGPRQVREYFEASRAGTSLSWHPVYADASASEDMGFTIGEYSSIIRGPSGAAVQRFGKYLTVWKRQGDGAWRFLVDGGNASPARADR